MFEAGNVEELASEQDQSVGSIAGLPSGYQLHDDGVHWWIKGADGDGRWCWLCSPLRVLALARGADGRGWGRLIEVTDADGTIHRWSMPAALLAGDGAEMRQALLDLGLRLSMHKNARFALSALLMSWTPTARARTADRLGWADERCSAFVLGDGRVIGDADVVYQVAHEPAAAAAMTAAGTLDDWREQVAALCINNPLLVFAVSSAFAGPLLELLGMESGGAHLRGASSTGKSTIQRAAVSVWGAPAFKHTWRATSNGLEGVAAACSATLLALDELAEIEAKDAGAAAYMLANGCGKSRANRHGSARASARWRVMILSSGEISLSDKMAEAGRRTKAGQEVRLLDIAADTRAHGAFDELHGNASGAAFADKLNVSTASAYGIAGPLFVEALLEDLDAARASIRTAMGEFEIDARMHRPLGDDGQVARALKRFALIAAAGELATAVGLTSWPPGEARSAALTVFKNWLDGRGGAGDHEAREAIERTRAFLLQHGASRFEPLDVADGEHKPVVHNRAGWKGDGCFCIAGDTWKEIHRGADATRAARALLNAGLLERGENKNLARKLSRVEGRPRAYAVPVKILGHGDDGGGHD